MNRPANATTTLARPAAKGRIRNRARSIIGWIEARSTATRAAPSTPKATRSPIVARLVQPHVWPSLRASSSANSATPESAAPRTSKDWPLPGFSSGSTRAAQATARSPIGALIRKIARHVATWVSSPPSAGPRLSPIETLTPLRPSARPRSLAGKVRATMAGPMAMIIAAPTPWTTRKPISAASFGAAPQQMLASVKTLNPTR